MNAVVYSTNEVESVKVMAVGQSTLTRRNEQFFPSLFRACLNSGLACERSGDFIMLRGVPSDLDVMSPVGKVVHAYLVECGLDHGPLSGEFTVSLDAKVMLDWVNETWRLMPQFVLDGETKPDSPVGWHNVIVWDTDARQYSAQLHLT